MELSWRDTEHATIRLVGTMTCVVEVVYEFVAGGRCDDVDDSSDWNVLLLT